MAWTADKNVLLRDMINERIQVELDYRLAQQWGLTKTWLQIINTYVTNTQKQQILNDLIDDKVVYLNTILAYQQQIPLNTESARDTLLTNKE